NGPTSTSSPATAPPTSPQWLLRWHLRPYASSPTCSSGNARSSSKFSFANLLSKIACQAPKWPISLKQKGIHSDKSTVETDKMLIGGIFYKGTVTRQLTQHKSRSFIYLQ